MKCDCKEWETRVGEISRLIMAGKTAKGHFLKWHTPAMKYCPWCGEELEADEMEKAFRRNTSN